MLTKSVYDDLLDNAIRNFHRTSWLCDQFYNAEVVFVVTKNIFDAMGHFELNNFTCTYNEDMSICYHFCGCDLFVVDAESNGSILFRPAIHVHQGYCISETSLGEGDIMVSGSKLFRFGETGFVDTGLTVRHSKRPQKPKEVDFSAGDTKLLDEFLESFSRKDGLTQMGG